MLSDEAPGTRRRGGPAEEGLPFARYMNRIADITPQGVTLEPAANPFPTKYAQRTSSITFNVAGYARQLVHDFLTEGGRLEHMEFHSPSELSVLPQKVIINATGYGARALWKDESVVPVRGQIAWLIPQPDVNYGVIYRDTLILGRRDGIVVQGFGTHGDMEGYNDTNETPDRVSAEQWVKVAAELFGRMRAV